MRNIILKSIITIIMLGCVVFAVSGAMLANERDNDPLLYGIAVCAACIGWMLGIALKNTK